LAIVYIFEAEEERDLINQSITGYNSWGQYPSLYSQRILEERKPIDLNSDQKQI